MSETTELSELVASTRSELHQMIAVLRVLESLLLFLAQRLPPDTGEDDLEEMAEHFELRAVILCVAKDCLRPAIEDLLAVVENRT
jgi:hypothetical protein